MKGRIRAGKKGKFCHWHERLVHIELSDLVVHKQYLQKGFMSGSIAPPGEESDEEASAVESASALESDESTDGKNKGKKGKGKGKAGPQSKSASSAPLSKKGLQRSVCSDCESPTYYPEYPINCCKF